MPKLPKVPKDLSLAPVAAAVDLNLQRLRDKEPDEIAETLSVELNTDAIRAESTRRGELVLRAAVRDVDLHSWDAKLTEDATRIRLTGGSVSVDLGLGAHLEHYIQGG
jgi:hypothetical protein